MNRAFTLVEMLAVVVVIGLVAGTLAVGLGHTAQASAWERARAEVKHFDRMARLEARTNGPVEIRVSGEAEVLTTVRPPERVEVLRGASVHALGFTQSGTTVPPSFGLMARSIPGAASSVVSAIPVDAAGRSVDFAYVVSDGERVLRVHVAGLTGFIWTEAPGE